MRELVLGTANYAKKEIVQRILWPVGVSVRTPADYGITVEIEENGPTAQHNAREKAITYAQILEKLVLSIDNALFIEGLQDDEQPGPHVRQVPGIDGRASDKDLIEFYSNKIGEIGGEAIGHWEAALCIATEKGLLLETTLVTPRIFVAAPSKQMIPQTPLASIQLDPKTRRYLSEMSEEEKSTFWNETIGHGLQQFVLEALRIFDNMN